MRAASHTDFAACTAYYRFAVDNPSHAQVMFGTDRELWDKAEPLPALDRTRAILLRIVHQCRLSGDLPGGLDDKEVLAPLWAHVHGFTLLSANRVLTERETGAREACLEKVCRSFSRDSMLRRKSDKRSHSG